jgi:hypothetical protein
LCCTPYGHILTCQTLGRHSHLYNIDTCLFRFCRIQKTGTPHGRIRRGHSLKDTSSVFAEEGTRAHELADRCLSSYTDAAFYIDNPNYDSLVTKDMADYVQVYLDTVAMSV